MAKKKRLTQREKQWNAQFKKEMQEKGILPPDKQRLNRKQFAKDVIKEWNEANKQEELTYYLYRSVFNMVNDNMHKVTSEQLGVLKALKLALETKKFMEKLSKEGRTQYTIGEYVDEVFSPIMRL